MREMISLQLVKQRREETLRGAERDRLARASRAARGRCAGWISAEKEDLRGSARPG
jgi:hypothetical protein